MALSTYAELLDSIADWLNRVGSPEVAERAPDFVRLAEARLNRELHTAKVRQMTKRDDTIFTVDGAFELPDDWLETKKITITWGGKPRKLDFVSEDQADEINRTSDLWLHGPSSFTYNGNLVELVPTPSDDLDVCIDYFAEIPALSESNTTNWLLQKWPDLYLYGALAHSAPYLRDDARVATWAGFYDRAMAEISTANASAVYSGQGLRTRARLRN